jgi:hypothetical protein
LTKLLDRISRHLALHGSIALIIAVLSLVFLRGLGIGIILLFGLPPLMAAVSTGRKVSKSSRGVAWTFLAALGIGAFIAHIPRLFPRLGGFDPRLAPWQDRMLTWYSGVYFVWLCLILPIHLFLGSLKAHRRGETAPFSRLTCYLGLIAAGLLWVGLPGVLALLGFWPVF